MSGETLELAGYDVFRDNAACTAVDHHDVLHFVAGIELHGFFMHLAHECRVSSEQELLSGLSFCVECTAYLHAAERTVGQEAAVFACKGNALGNALVYYVCANLGKAVNVSLACAVVAAFYSVVEQAVNRVAVVLIILCSVDTALCGYRVSAAG